MYAMFEGVQFNQDRLVAKRVQIKLRDTEEDNNGDQSSEWEEKMLNIRGGCDHVEGICVECIHNWSQDWLIRLVMNYEYSGGF